jgi:alkyl hydroperoxide reductase subunit D
MESITLSENALELLEAIGLRNPASLPVLEQLDQSGSRYLVDLKLNFKTSYGTDHLSHKELELLGLSLAANASNAVLLDVFRERAASAGASAEEQAEAIACASLLSANNVLYRFRHFTGKEKYQQIPARLKMNIMMKPVTGKEFFELMSLAVSAVNGCEMCVNAHEASLIQLNSREERIFEAIRFSSVFMSLTKVIH